MPVGGGWAARRFWARAVLDRPVGVRGGVGVWPDAIVEEFWARVASVAGGDSHLQPEAGEGGCAAGGATRSAIREQWLHMAMVR